MMRACLCPCGSNDRMPTIVCDSMCSQPSIRFDGAWIPPVGASVHPPIFSHTHTLSLSRLSQKLSCACCAQLHQSHCSRWLAQRAHVPSHHIPADPHPRNLLPARPEKLLIRPHDGFRINETRRLDALHRGDPPSYRHRGQVPFFIPRQPLFSLPRRPFALCLPHDRVAAVVELAE